MNELKLKISIIFSGMVVFIIAFEYGWETLPGVGAKTIDDA